MSFYGSTLQVTAVFPTLEDTAFGPYEFSPATGVDDFEFLAAGGIDEQWDVREYTIEIITLETNTASNGEVNAWLIEDIFNHIPDIQGVEIVGDETTADFDGSMIEWSDDSILINYVRDGRGISVVEGQTLTLDVSFDPLSGTDLDDVIRGTRGSNQIDAEGGDDIVFGRGGADTLSGGSGNDRLVGGRGRDELNGGSGDDILVGSGGADTFVFSEGHDIARGFNGDLRRERVDLSEAAGIDDFEDLLFNHLRDTGRHIVIEDNEGNTLRLANVDLEDLGANDFIF